MKLHLAKYSAAPTAPSVEDCLLDVERTLALVTFVQTALSQTEDLALRAGYSDRRVVALGYVSRRMATGRNNQQRGASGHREPETCGERGRRIVDTRN
jgi:hypothetical protein